MGTSRGNELLNIALFRATLGLIHNDCKMIIQRGCGGQVVSTRAYFINDPTSNPAGFELFLLIYVLFKKTESEASVDSF